MINAPSSLQSMSCEHQAMTALAVKTMNTPHDFRYTSNAPWFLGTTSCGGGGVG